MRKLFIVQIINMLILLFVSGMFYNHLHSFENNLLKQDNDSSEKWMEQMYIENNIYESIQNDNNRLDIADFSMKEPILVCYYSSLTCSSCVDYAISKIEEHFPDAKSNPRIYFIACDFNEKEVFKQSNTIKLHHRSHILPINESNSVCYFVLSNKTVLHTFVPESNFGSYTDTYLKEIRKRYFKKM